jgi:signal transduction histidine kinase
MFPQKQFRFATTLDVQLRWPVDEQDFSEVIGNLLENAGKWSSSVVDLRLSESTEGLILKVSDDGPGIQEEDRERLLERWIRLDEQVDGYGLGLSIVKEIMDGYGGRIELLEASLGGLQVDALFPR